jgi:ABC-type multidrug transport system fused ATPase/permease subunit
MLSRLHSDVESLQTVMASTFVDLITDLVTIVAVLGFLLYIDWRLTLVSLAVFPFMAVTMAYLSRKIRTKSRQVREQIADILHFFQETISGMKLVQSFVREKYEARRFVRKGKEMINLRVGLGVFGSLSTASAVFFGALGPALVLYYGAYRVMTTPLSIGWLLAFYFLVVKLLAPVFRLAQLNVIIQTALASIDRIFEFLDVEPEIRDVPNAMVPRAVEGEVEFENITFYYRPEEPVLEKISFTVKSGERVAIVGPTGVGKSTIIDLICRFYDPVAGAVKLDGIDIRQIKLNRLRALIGIVSQETYLFNASIRENLRYGNLKAADSQVIEAARRANIHDFIETLADGYETLVGDRGLRLSGGERQRLAIARAILKDPRILILDEATSALDSKSETLIQDALEPLMLDRTTITIAHRLSTVVDSDAILVLSNGKIAERGTHRELLAASGVYKMLWDEQVKKTSR